MEIKLGETFRVGFTTARFSSGAAYDASVLPTAAITEDGTALVYAPTVDKVAATTGLYGATVVASAGNGFEVGKSYSLYVTATVDGVTSSAEIASFIVRAVGADDVALASVWTTTVAGRIDAAITSRSLHSAADVWSVGTRTLTSYGTLAATVAAAVWDYLTSAATVVGSMGALLVRLGAKILAPGSVRVVTPGPTDGGVIELIKGDAYDADHDNEIRIPIPTAPDLAGATHAFYADGITAAVTTATVEGVDDDRDAVVELSTVNCDAICDLVLPGTPRPTERVWWRVVSTWTADSPAKPQTIATGEIRRPEWDVL